MAGPGISIRSGDAYYRSHSASADHLYKSLNFADDFDLSNAILYAVGMQSGNKAPASKPTSPLAPTVVGPVPGNEGHGESGGRGNKGNGSSEFGPAVGGLGAPGLVGSAVGTAASVGAQLGGVPGALAGALGSMARGVATTGLESKDLADIAAFAALSALGVPGLATAALKGLNISPMETIDSIFGTNMTGIGGLLGPSDRALGYSDSNLGVSSQDGATGTGRPSAASEEATNADNPGFDSLSGQVAATGTPSDFSGVKTGEESSIDATTDVGMSDLAGAISDALGATADSEDSSDTSDTSDSSDSSDSDSDSDSEGGGDGGDGGGSEGGDGE